MENRNAFELSSQQEAVHREFSGSREMAGFFTWLKGKTEDFAAGRETPDSIDFIQTDHERGCILSMGEFGYSLAQCLSIAENLKQNAMEYGYKLYMSDSYDKGEKKIYRHYLKPPLRREEKLPSHQLFGNLHVEVHVRANRPDHLSIYAKGYPGKEHIHDVSLPDLINILSGGQAS